MSIEFLDRYGPKGPPSALRGCSRCEAMGCYPDMPGYDAGRYGSLDSVTFLKCANCRGTGRCSWAETLRRVPQWLRNSARFVANGPSRYGRNTPYDWWLRFRCSFLSDLGWRVR